MSLHVVVIGAGMGGLSAAIYARLSGHEVLVLEKSAEVGGKACGIDIGEYSLDPGPSIIILPRVYEGVFRDAGRPMKDYLQFDRLDVVSRVFFGHESPIDLPASESACMELLREIDAHDADALRSLMDTLERVEPLLEHTIYDHPFLRPTQLLDPRLLRFGMGFNPLRTYRELVNAMFRSRLVRAFFYGFPSYGGQSYDAKSPGAFLIPYYMLRDGVYFPKHGVRAIPRAFHRLAVELGVEFRFGAEVSSLEGDGRTLRAIGLRSGERVTADAFISNVDRSSVAKWSGHAITAKPSYSYFTVHRGIRRRYPELSHHNLMIPVGFERSFDDLYRRGQFPMDPIVYVNSTGSTDPEAAPPGCSNIFSVVTSPARIDTCSWESVDEYRDRTDRALSRCGITWSEAEVDFERVQTPLYFEDTHANYRGSLYGLDERHRMWGMFPASNQDRRWRNLTYCGGSVQPGAGLPMVTLSGKFAAQLLRS